MEEELKENPTCLFCNGLTTSDFQITNDLNSTIVTLFDGKQIVLFNCHLCSECHSRLLEAKDILTLLDRLQSRLKAITTNLRNLMNEKTTITSNDSEARSQLLLNLTHEYEFDADRVEPLKDPLGLEDEAYDNTECDNNFYKLGTTDSDFKQPTTSDIQDSEYNENDGSNHVSDFDSFFGNEEEDIGNSSLVKATQVRCQKFSDAESKILWKEYLRSRRKSESGKISIRVWSKIARIVSKVDNIKRTSTQCRKRLVNLKQTLNKSTNVPVWLKSVEIDEDERHSSQSEFECDSEEIGFDSQCKENVRNNQVSDFNPVSSPKDRQNNSEAVLVRCQKFSDEESKVLWKEYLRRRHKTQDGKLSTRIWSKIARRVSKVNEVKRTRKQCRKRLENLKYKLNKTTSKSDRETAFQIYLESGELDEDEKLSSKSESETELESEDTGSDCDSECIGNDGNDQVSYFNPMSNPEDPKNNSEASQLRSQIFSEAESTELWKEYLKRRRKSKNGKLSTRIWSKIARIVSKVNEVKRTPSQCQKRIENLKYKLSKANGKSDRGTYVIPDWLKSVLDEDESQRSESEIVPKDTFKIFNIKTVPAEKFSVSEIRILWTEYMKRESEIKGTPAHQTSKIWRKIAKIHTSRCKTNRSFIQCRKKVENLLYKGRYLKYGLLRSGDQLEDTEVKATPEIQSLPSVYNIVTQNGPVELKTAVLELPKCDAFLQLPKVSKLPSTRIQKLRERLLRRQTLKESLKTEEQPYSGEKNNNISGVTYECSKCLKKFRTKVRLEFHENRTHQLKHNCVITTCTLDFGSIVALESHIKYDHTEIQQTHACELEGCWRKFYTEKGLKYHHQRSHDESTKNFVCEICAMKFFNLSRLKAHCSLTHNPGRYTCEYCKKVYKTKNKLREHQTQKHGSMDPEKFKPELQNCNICGYIAHTRNYLDRHMKSHTKDFKFHCSVPGCDYGAVTMNTLKIHLQKHNPTPQHQCHLCPAKFKYKGGLQHHMQAHTGIKKYKCDSCGKEFAHHSNWKSHNEIHHMPPEIRYMCNKCGTGFTAYVNYQNHRKKCR